MHKGDLHTKIQEAQLVLGLAERFYDDAEAKIDILANHTPTPAQLQDYFETLYLRRTWKNIRKNWHNSSNPSNPHH